MMCPECGSELEHLSFFKSYCPKCKVKWVITKITDKNRMYYKK